MSEVMCARGDDRLSMVRSPVEPGPLLARWRNADAYTRDIREISCVLRDGQPHVQLLAVGPDGPADWGEVPMVLYSDISATGGGRAAAEATVDGQPTAHYADVSVTESGPAFLATFDHGFLRVHLQARINLGLLVVAMFNEFADDSGRADYFHREVFFREPERDDAGR